MERSRELERTLATQQQQQAAAAAAAVPSPLESVYDEVSDVRVWVGCGDGTSKHNSQQAASS